MPEYLPWSGLVVNMKCVFFNKKKVIKKTPQKTKNNYNDLSDAYLKRYIDFLIYKLNIFKNTIRNQVQL